MSQEFAEQFHPHFGGQNALQNVRTILLFGVQYGLLANFGPHSGPKLDVRSAGTKNEAIHASIPMKPCKRYSYCES